MKHDHADEVFWQARCAAGSGWCRLPASATPRRFPPTIKLVLPYTAGSPNDVIARVIAPVLSARLGQPVVVDNRPGGGTTIGLKTVMSSDPDGHTLLFTNTPTHVIAQLVARASPTIRSRISRRL